MKRLLTGLSLFVALTLHSQEKVSPWNEEGVRNLAKNGTEQEILTSSSMLTQEGYLYYAEILADRLLEIKPASSNYNYRKGFLMLEIRRDYIGAIPFFQKAILDTDPNFDMYSANEKSSPTDSYYHLARCYHFNEELDKAEEQYTNFINTSKKKSERIPDAQLRLQQLQTARKLMNEPVKVYLENVGKKVNTKYPEYSSVVSLDGSALYFTSRRPWANNETEDFRDPSLNQYTEDVYVSYMDFDGSWTEPIRLEFCLPERNEATIAVSTDERRVYLYQDDKGNGDLYYTDFYAAKFNTIEFLKDKNINTDYWETHCMVSNDGTHLFLVSDRPGGYGGRDLYMSKKRDDGTWSKPENLGPGINGPKDDDAPFVSINNKQLYFATNDSRSIGGFDIMMSELNEDGTWGEAINLGYPFNSTNDDIYYTTTVDGLRGFMTSYRPDGFGEKDIYEIKNEYLGVKTVCVLDGTIKTLDGSPLPEDFAINVSVNCDDCDPKDVDRLVFPRLRDGKFITALKPCQTYTLKYKDATTGAVMGEESFTTKCDVEYEEIKRELILDVPNKKILFPKDTIQDVPEVIVADFPNIEFMHYFDYNKNKLTVKKGELNDFVKEVEKQLKDGREKITINIYSSASKVPTRTYETNDKLTLIRAENMKYDLMNYFEKESDYKDKVNIVIVTTVVQGPEYNKDSSDTSKYRPYQYVGLKTE